MDITTLYTKDELTGGFTDEDLRSATWSDFDGYGDDGKDATGVDFNDYDD